jgi:hypothetical protein
MPKRYHHRFYFSPILFGEVRTNGCSMNAVMPKRRLPRGFAIAELVTVLAMLVMLVTLVVAIAVGATQKFSKTPVDSGVPSPAKSLPVDKAQRNAG